MNRRDFLKAVGSAVVLAPVVSACVWAPLEGSPQMFLRSEIATPEQAWWCRPQKTTEDLIAEWEAWQADDLDGHDRVISAQKRVFSDRLDARNERQVYMARWLSPHGLRCIDSR